jgi:hypothetical protein
MSNKTEEKTTRPASPAVTVTKPDTVYVTRQEKEQLKKATAGNGGFKAQAPAAAVEQPAPGLKPSPPLSPLAASWPDSVAQRTGIATSREQAAAPKAPAAATAPKPSPAAPPSPPPTRPAPATPPPQPASVAQASKAKAAKTVAVNFALRKPEAKQVFVSGDFNGWSPSSTPMRQHGDGRWETTVAVAPGQHQYKFIVDGEWIADPAAQKNVPNDRGSLNSVLEARAA